LGTDVSGGYDLSILTAIQNASIASKVISTTNRDAKSPTPTTPAGFANKPLPIPTLLYLATAGGAAVCNLEHQIGDFKVGKSFDALVVSVRGDAGNPGVWGTEFDDCSDKKSLELWLERFLFCGDDRNIRRVYVQGKLVGGTAFHGP
jgi:guanine deaminase